MKNNLKNRPVKSTPQNYERWMKALEKELRELVKDQPSREWLTEEWVKEILGE